MYSNVDIQNDYGEDPRTPSLQGEGGESTDSTFSLYEANELKTHLYHHKCAKTHLQPCRNSIFSGVDHRIPRFKGGGGSGEDSFTIFCIRNQ